MPKAGKFHSSPFVYSQVVVSYRFNDHFGDVYHGPVLPKWHRLANIGFVWDFRS